jgi:hypothetical protein
MSDSPMSLVGETAHLLFTTALLSFLWENIQTCCLGLCKEEFGVEGDGVAFVDCVYWT